MTESDAMLSDILAKYLELDKVTLIKCGGKDRIASEREQWNDGSNTLCIEPGKVVVYDRNYVTNASARYRGTGNGKFGAFQRTWWPTMYEYAA